MTGKTKSPTLYIIAGPNGAGKTTASFNVLPSILDCKEFVNADEIARGLSPFDPESVAIQAGKLMLARIDDLLRQGVSFGIETTLATSSYINLVEKAKQVGYRVNLLFFWLESPLAAKNRVSKRVREGGHNIPDDIIERRYWRGLQNFFEKFMSIVDYWVIYDNNYKTAPIASSVKIFDDVLLNKIRVSCQNKS